MRENTHVTKALSARHRLQVRVHTRDDARGKLSRSFDAALVAPASAHALEAHVDGGIHDNSNSSRAHALREIYLRK